jgi:hypothetical protein
MSNILDDLRARWPNVDFRVILSNTPNGATEVQVIISGKQLGEVIIQELRKNFPDFDWTVYIDGPREEIQIAGANYKKHRKR